MFLVELDTSFTHEREKSNSYEVATGTETYLCPFSAGTSSFTVKSILPRLKIM